MVVTSADMVQSLIERNVNSSYEKSNSPLDMRRLELELGTIGDHDIPYTFALPASMPQTLAWTNLLVKVYAGKLEP